MSHTKEPWSFSPAENGLEWGVEAGKWGVAICADAPGNGTSEANARRIVACVNACAGISTESMEVGGVGSILSLGLEEQRRRDVAEQQRDELLARLEVVCEVQIISPAYDRIRAENVFAIDDLEYDHFAAGWKAAIDTVKGGA